MKRAAVVAVAGLAAVLAGCSATLDTGTVIDRDYSDAHCTTSLMPVGKGGLIPITNCYPKTWTLRLRNVDGDEGDAGVSAVAFDRCQIGDHYPECKDRER